MLKDVKAIVMLKQLQKKHISVRPYSCDECKRTFIIFLKLSDFFLAEILLDKRLGEEKTSKSSP